MTTQGDTMKAKFSQKSSEITDPAVLIERILGRGNWIKDAADAIENAGFKHNVKGIRQQVGRNKTDLRRLAELTG